MGERLICIQKVSGSTPLGSTTNKMNTTVIEEELNLANITLSQFDDYVSQMADPKYYDRLHRNNVVIQPHIHKSGDRFEQHLQNCLPEFIQNYNNLKDVSWPAVHTYQEFNQLPASIKFECMSKGLSLNRWQLNQRKSISAVVKNQRLLMLIPVIKLVMNNIAYIKNKRVLEFYPGRGKLSGSMLHVGCQSLAIVDHTELIQHCQRNLNSAFDTSNVTYHDIKKYNTITYSNFDTVIIAEEQAKWNNTQHNNNDIIESVVAHRPKNIIIEFDRKVNGRPFNTSNRNIHNNYKIIKQDKWIFHLDNIKVDKELCIYEHIN